MKTPLKMGIIGCGIAARELHWPALKELTRDIDISAVCNHHIAKAQDFASMVEAETGKKPLVFSDYRDLLALPDLEAVDVLLPVELNLPVCRAAMTAGKHVLVEKPLAENLGNAREMVALAGSRPGQVMMVAENFRYREVFAWLGREIAAGTIGRPCLVQWNCWQHVDPASNQYARTQWRIDHQYDGGFVTDAGVHYIAALRDLFGEAEFVDGIKFCHNPAIGRTDMLSAGFTMSKGGVNGMTGAGPAGVWPGAGTEGNPGLSGKGAPVTGTGSAGKGGQAGPVEVRLTLGFSVHSPWLDELRILGTEGSFLVRGSHVEVQKAKDGQIQSESRDFGADNGYKAELADFAAAVRQGKPGCSTAARAFGDLETILGLLARSRRG